MPVSFQISACSGRSLISQILRTLRLCSFGMTGMWCNKRGKGLEKKILRDAGLKQGN
ncbi:MAG TPA: hypothetical protein PLS58_13570 [Bacteroidales bacterium]|nr:hypothetical protein [Bacteroidales bacterium]